jgi:hypothetical protein
MAYGCFTDRSDEPDLGRAEGAVGAARPLWDEVLESIAALTRAQPSWRFYGRNYGWAVAFKKSGRALTALFPDEDRFTVLVVLSAAQADAALADTGLSAATRELIGSLPRFKEGCWAFVAVGDAARVADARRLIAIRSGRGVAERASQNSGKTVAGADPTS